MGEIWFVGAARNESGTLDRNHSDLLSIQRSTLVDHRVLPSPLTPGITHISPSAHVPISNLCSQQGSCRNARGNRKLWTGYPTTGQWVGFPSAPISLSLRPPCSQKQSVSQAREDHQAQFYQIYREVAEAYDSDLLKICDDDLNATLIFVSFTRRFGGCVLAKSSGRSILCCDFRLHRPSRLSTTA